MTTKLEQAEHGPVVFYRCTGCGHAYESFAPSSCDCMEGKGFSRIEYCAAPVRTKDLTDEEVMDLAMNEGAMEFDCEKISFARAVIAADRALNNPSSDLL